MSAPAMHDRNTDQAAYWNGPGGQGWLAAQARLDRSLVEIGGRALELADARSGEKAIDVGCGPGGTTAALAKSVGPDGHVLGVDISRPLIEAAQAQALANATFLVADATTHSFEAASFDLVDRKSTRLNSSHSDRSRMPSSA